MSEEVTPIVHQDDCEGFENDVARADGICNSMCMIHMECEPSREGDFKVCSECLHVFRTPKELVDLHMEVLISINSKSFIRPAAAEIQTCPVCTHDF